MLLVVREQRNELTYETPWWVGHYDVGLIKQRHTLLAAEVAVALERRHRIGVVTQQVLDVS